MRIIKIEFENLNSLKGRWSIDFTYPDYKKNHDLFVICGPTGSGKTTILDAITLALYGRTPRQADAGTNSSESQIMTRDTASVTARVTYKCRRGIFESSFSRRKARGNADGRLQAADCYIKNLEDGLSESFSTASALALKNTQIIQLAYEQFCRSIMLAQGEFDRFLLCGERERAQILAKLNGTENYKLFAAKLWEKAKNEISRIDELKKELEGIEVLDEDEVKRLEEEKKSFEKENLVNKKTLEQIEKDLKWHEKRDSLEEELKAAEKNRTETQLLKERFKESEVLIKKIEKSLACEKEYALYKDIKKRFEELKNNIDAHKVRQERLEKEYTEASALLENSIKKGEEFNKTLEENEKLWKQVSDLDARLEPVKKRYEEALRYFKESEEDFLQKKENLKKFEEELKTSETELKTAVEYLTAHSSDESLLSRFELIEKTGRDLVRTKDNLSELSASLSGDEKTLEALKKSRAELEKRSAALEDELKGFVSKEYEKVALIIRGTLKEGQACPVCGSLSHKKGKENECAQDSREKEIKENISELTSSLDSSKEELEKINASILEREQYVKAFRERFESQSAEFNSSLEVLNSGIKDSGCIFDEELKNTEDVLKKLKAKKDEYKNTLDKKNELAEFIKETKIKIESMEIKKTEEKYLSLKEMYVKTEDEYKSSLEQRKKLFGEKDVENEKNKSRLEKESLELQTGESQEKVNKVREELSAVKSLFLSDCKKEKETAAEYEGASKKIEAALKENGFDSEEEFLEAAKRKGELPALKNEGALLKTRDDTSKAELERVKKEFDVLENEEKPEKDGGVLSLEKEELERSFETNIERLSEIKLRLENDGRNQSRRREKALQIENSVSEREKWVCVQKIIGVAGGDDLEVFVQALAFKALLSSANKYIYDITGKYTLVQKENAVDFLVHDENFPDSKDDRPVSNMSGGEKFIISLSLALAIAELASRNVQVDSLFLDEGFGTLSGEPLIQAVNALKSLQSRGKMIGIITHIDAVIKEFDQRIEASKRPGGRSVLTGSGITSAL